MDQAALERLVHEILGEGYIAYGIGQYTLTEDMREGCARIECELTAEGSPETREIKGIGVGLVDALFKGLKATLSAEYPSLDHIHFVDFNVSGDFRAARTEGGSDALGHVQLVVENTSGKQFQFTSDSHSVTASTCNVVVNAVEHFVNAELAVLRIYDWIEDAKERSRPDLAEQYTRRLAELVQNATYSESIERLRQQSGF